MYCFYCRYRIDQNAIQSSFVTRQSYFLFFTNKFDKKNVIYIWKVINCFLHQNFIINFYLGYFRIEISIFDHYGNVPFIYSQWKSYVLYTFMIDNIRKRKIYLSLLIVCIATQSSIPFLRFVNDLLEFSWSFHFICHTLISCRQVNFLAKLFILKL